MDFYLILGVDRAASKGDLKRAYTRLARRYHPDINPGDQEAEAFYHRVTEAYETLIDPERRQAYDVHGQTLKTRESPSVEFHGFDFSAPVAGASVTFAELFSEVLTAPGTESSEVERGSDLFADLALTFEEALRGTEQRLTVTRLEVCAPCGGSGMRRGPETACSRCQGSGATQWRRGHMVFSKSCSRCGGTGRQRRRPCTSCRAEGVDSLTEQIAVHVPAGVADGTRMRVPGKGNAGRKGGSSGDLYITAKVGEHRLFGRDGDDLLLDLPITLSEAVLGARIAVPTLDGRTELRIPPGTSSGQRFRIEGAGAPSPRTGAPGDLLVTVTLTLPQVDDDRSKELLREFGRINATDVRRHLFVE